MMDDLDIKKLLEESLDENSLFVIPENFADKVCKKVNVKMERRRLYVEWGLKMSVILGVLLILLGIFWYLDSNILNFVSENLTSVLLFTMMFVFVFYIDQVLLKLVFLLKRNRS